MRFEMLLREAEEHLLDSLGTLTRIKPLSKKRGKIEIFFQGESELGDIVRKIIGQD